jgi:hypothetical protein
MLLALLTVVCFTAVPTALMLGLALVASNNRADKLENEILDISAERDVYAKRCADLKEAYNRQRQDLMAISNVSENRLKLSCLFEELEEEYDI